MECDPGTVSNILKENSSTAYYETKARWALRAVGMDPLPIIQLHEDTSPPVVAVTIDQEVSPAFLVCIPKPRMDAFFKVASIMGLEVAPPQLKDLSDDHQ